MKKLLLILMLLLLVGVSSAQVVSTSSVTAYVGGTANTAVYLSTVPAGFSGCNVTITVSNTSVITLTAITLPSWATVSTSSGIPGNKVTFLEADASNLIVAGQTNILLATISTKGLAAGTATFNVAVNELDDEAGNPVSPTVTNGTATVTSTAYPIRAAASVTVAPVDTAAYVALIDAMGGNVTPTNETDATINFTGIVEGGMLPYTNAMGIFAWFILLVIPFTMLWIVQGKAWIPLVLGLMVASAALMMGYIPADYAMPVMAFIGLSVAAIVYSLYKGDR